MCPRCVLTVAVVQLLSVIFAWKTGQIYFRGSDAVMQGADCRLTISPAHASSGATQYTPRTTQLLTDRSCSTRRGRPIARSNPCHGRKQVVRSSCNFDGTHPPAHCLRYAVYNAIPSFVGGKVPASSVAAAMASPPPLRTCTRAAAHAANLRALRTAVAGYTVLSIVFQVRLPIHACLATAAFPGVASVLPIGRLFVILEFWVGTPFLCCSAGCVTHGEVGFNAAVVSCNCMQDGVLTGLHPSPCCYLRLMYAMLGWHGN